MVIGLREAVNQDSNIDKNITEYMIGIANDDFFTPWIKVIKSVILKVSIPTKPVSSQKVKKEL